MNAKELSGDVSDVAQLIIETLSKCDSVQQARIVANRLRRTIDDICQPVVIEARPQPVEPMEYNEAFHMARELIEYGQYKGQCYGEIPRSYLDWLVEAKRTEWRRLASFLRSPIAPEREVEDDE